MAPPRACRCGRTVPSGRSCVCQLERKRQADQRRGTARERGYTAEWERESKAFLALPENRFCACGCGRVADMVDHKRPHKGDMQLFWDRSNWQAMKRGCHSRKTAGRDGGFGNAMSRNNVAPGVATDFALNPGTARDQSRATPTNSALGTGRR